jgi:hypothetical protein
MKKLFGLAAFMAVMALSACGGMPGTGDGGGNGGYDAAQTMIDHYKTNGVQCWVVVHDNPQEGQAWEYTSKNAAGESMSGWMCCKREGDTAMVEWDMGQGFIIAFMVDLTKKEKANVTKAYIGKKGGAPEECKVVAYVEPTGDAPAPNYTKTEEDGTLNAAGKDWPCTITTLKGEGWESKTWTAKSDGWFGGMLKTEMAGSETVLTTVRTDCKPWLDWAAMKKEG